MTFSNNDIKHIARLARLTLTEQEIKKYRREISGIVGYVDKLASANVSNQEATLSLTSADNLLRNDLVADWDKLEKENTLNAAPRKKGRLVVVPKILES
ncbi:MAG: Asp-tRNA(Asn)/Glu-tRNA(Gln) amidotransferase subunit GatC [Candidatus Falkowbacteria bacterium]|nr:Asp-tRNA(Asn)/Glu-tRNA(Gln) amidotransferase subunit GatC [Candidatus Falkowbacteria bacterium]